MTLLRQLFFALFFTSLTAIASKEPVYTTLKTLAPQKDKKETTAAAPSLTIKGKNSVVTKAADLTLHVPNTHECRHLYLSILEELNPVQPEISIIDPEVLRKLNLIIGTETKNSNNVAHKFPTASLFGKTAVEILLATPSSSIELLEKRQALIRFFVENPDAAERVKNAAEKIKAGQALFLSFFQPMDDAEKQIFDSFYFSSLLGRLNKSATALEFSEMLHELYIAYCFAPWGTTSRLSSNVINGIYEAFVKSRSKSWLKTAQNYAVEVGVKAPARAIRDIAKETVIDYSPYQYCTSNAQYDKNGSLISVNIDPSKGFASPVDLYRIVRSNPIMKNSVLGTHTGAIAYLTTGYLIQNCIQAYFISSGLSNLTTTRAVFINLQTKLMGVARIVEGLEEIAQVMKDYNLNEYQELTGQINAFLDHKNSSYHLGKLLQLLATDTFKGEPSFASHKGRILAANTFMNEDKEAFVPALQEAGLIEALNAAAELVTSRADKEAQFCFASYKTEAQPSLELEGLWNILSDADKAVLNNVLLDQKSSANILLSGPNMSGKSYFMKSTAINLILAQTFGIAAAQKALLTPFDSIQVYLDEKEDINQNLSSFMAQKEKLDFIIRKLQQTTAQCSFSIIDEPLNGTVESSAGEFVREAGLKLAQLSNSCCILATHAQEPTLLEQDTNRRFANYHLGIQENADGSFTLTHELKEGILDWWFTDLKKRKAFINGLMNAKSQGLIQPQYLIPLIAAV